MSENNQPNYLTTLANFLIKPEVKHAWFNNKEVKLDGYKFEFCRFDNCKLIVTSINFELEHCHIDNSTIIEYGSEIVKIVRLFNSRYEWIYQKMPFFAPVRNNDGTITIKA